MPLEFFEVTDIIPGTPEEIYAAWLDSVRHAAMTRSPTTIEGFVNGSFTAGDGYIQGRTLELEPGRRIVQSWRSNEFPVGAEDSRVDIRFEPTDSGTRVTLAHFDIPEGQSQRYRESWQSFYFDRMKQYFGGEGQSFDEETTPASSEVPPMERSAKKARPRKAGSRRAKTSRKSARKARATRGPKRRGRKSAGKRTAARRTSAAKRSKKKSPARRGAKRRTARRSKR